MNRGTRKQTRKKNGFHNKEKKFRIARKPRMATIKHTVYVYMLFKMFWLDKSRKISIV